MSQQSNRKYYTARVDAELALAAEAKDPAIKALHHELALRYTELLESLGDSPAEQRLRTVSN